MTVFILDNSVAVRWFFEASAHSYADAILRDLVSSASEALVPVLWRYEVSSVLARAQNFIERVAEWLKKPIAHHGRARLHQAW